MSGSTQKQLEEKELSPRARRKIEARYLIQQLEDGILYGPRHIARLKHVPFLEPRRYHTFRRKLSNFTSYHRLVDFPDGDREGKNAWYGKTWKNHGRNSNPIEGETWEDDGEWDTNFLDRLSVLYNKHRARKRTIAGGSVSIALVLMLVFHLMKPSPALEPKTNGSIAYREDMIHALFELRKDSLANHAKDDHLYLKYIPAESVAARHRLFQKAQPEGLNVLVSKSSVKHVDFSEPPVSFYYHGMAPGMP